jgi:hypothetical protein
MLALVQAAGLVDPHPPPSPAALVNCCKRVNKSLFPSTVHEGRGAPSGRVL